MLIYEYKLDGSKHQYVAIDEAIRTVQFIRNKCLRLWMDGRGISKNDLQLYCSTLAKEYPFAKRLNSQARQSSADRAWFAIDRFYTNCREKKPGKKGYPQFQHDNRSVEYKQTGWKLDDDGKHITFADGYGIGRLRLVGNKKQHIETFPVKDIKRVRIVRRANGYYVQFGVKTERKVEHVPSGTQIGIDVGLKSFLTDSQGNQVSNPRHYRKAEKRLKRLQRRHSRTQKKSANRKKARKALASQHLKVQRQREDFARKTANALVSSHDLIAYEHLQIRNMVRNRKLAKSIHDAGWGIFLQWLNYYAFLHNIPVIAVAPHYTSQNCSACGTVVNYVDTLQDVYIMVVDVDILLRGTLNNPQKRCPHNNKKALSVRTHICPGCGVVLDRDHNAALNILEKALSSIRGCTEGHSETDRLAL